MVEYMTNNFPYNEAMIMNIANRYVRINKKKWLLSNKQINELLNTVLQEPTTVYYLEIPDIHAAAI